MPLDGGWKDAGMNFPSPICTTGGVDPDWKLEKLEDWEWTLTSIGNCSERFEGGKTKSDVGGCSHRRWRYNHLAS